MLGGQEPGCKMQNWLGQENWLQDAFSRYIDNSFPHFSPADSPADARESLEKRHQRCMSDLWVPVSLTNTPC